ncbi:MAG TPA: TadE/TadG family type IV pilus assembly protein [Anaerolineales bacterium]|nr:TadE/TadG family type IV pilus assembly protein [Anaerolineales bacterium]
MIEMQPTCKTERGQSLMELAFSLMFLLVLLSGVVDLGRAFFTYMAMRDAAQEGALYGSINPSDIEIKNHVLYSSDMMQNTLTADEITIEWSDPASKCTGNAVTVSIDYPDFPLTMPFIGTFLGRQTVAISASVTDTILTPSCP